MLAVFGVLIWKEFASAPAVSRKLIPARFMFLRLGWDRSRSHHAEVVEIELLCRDPSLSLAASISIW